MADVFRTLVVTAAKAPLARSLAAGLSERGGGMFTAALSGNGSAPATYYISTGLIDEAIAALLTDAEALHAACVAAGASVSLAQCQALVDTSDVTDEPPFDALERLGLQLVSEEA